MIHYEIRKNEVFDDVYVYLRNTEWDMSVVYDIKSLIQLLDHIKSMLKKKKTYDEYVFIDEEDVTTKVVIAITKIRVGKRNKRVIMLNRIDRFEKTISVDSIYLYTSDIRRLLRVLEREIYQPATV